MGKWEVTSPHLRTELVFSLTRRAEVVPPVTICLKHSPVCNQEKRVMMNFSTKPTRWTQKNQKSVESLLPHSSPILIWDPRFRKKFLQRASFTLRSSKEFC